MKHLKKIRLEHILLILGIVLYIIYAYSEYKQIFVEGPKFAAMEDIDFQSEEWLRHERRSQFIQIYACLYQAVTTISIFVMIVREKAGYLIIYFALSLMISWIFSQSNGKAFILNFYMPLISAFGINKYLYRNIAALILALIVLIIRHIIPLRKRVH